MTSAWRTGADSVLLGAFETVYGTPPTDGYTVLNVRPGFDLDSARPVGFDPLLGQGRNVSGAYYEEITVDGNAEPRVDAAAFGWWLKLLFGAPTTTTVKAAGEITFSAQPANNATITLNGTTWTFVTSGATGAQTNIGVDLDATLTALAGDLNGSADAEVAKCTYVADLANDRITIEFDTAGLTGNAFTLAASTSPASNASVSAATLLGGGYSHVYTSGGTPPSAAIEVGAPNLTTPSFRRYAGVMAGSCRINLERTGPVNATIGLIGQKLAGSATATIDASPTAIALVPFASGKAAMTINGAALTRLSGASVSLDNGLEAVRTIRADGLADGVAPGAFRLSGSITRIQGVDDALDAAIAAETPVALTYAWTHPLRWSFTLAVPRALLPKAKQALASTGVVSSEFPFEAELDAVAGHTARLTLVNGVASYA